MCQDVRVHVSVPAQDGGELRDTEVEFLNAAPFQQATLVKINRRDARKIDISTES